MNLTTKIKQEYGRRLRVSQVITVLIQLKKEQRTELGQKIKRHAMVKQSSE